MSMKKMTLGVAWRVSTSIRVIKVVAVVANGIPDQIKWEGRGAVGLFLLLGYLRENVSLKGLPTGQVFSLLCPNI